MTINLPNDDLGMYVSRCIYLQTNLNNVLPPCPFAGSGNGGGCGKKKTPVCMCVCVPVCVCFCICVRAHFWGEQAFGPYGVTTLLTYMLLTPPPPRGENSRQTTDKARTLQITHTLMPMCTHKGFSSDAVYGQIINLHTWPSYYIFTCESLIFWKGRKAITLQ